MKIDKIILENFKSIEKAEINLDSKSTILFGINGSGKSTVLRSINLVFSSIRMIENRNFSTLFSEIVSVNCTHYISIS